MQRRLASIATHPELADVYRLLGRKDPAWDELYKVYELLSKAVGGEQKLPKRTGVARERIQLLKDNSNNPRVDRRRRAPRRPYEEFPWERADNPR